MSRSIVFPTRVVEVISFCPQCLANIMEISTKYSVQQGKIKSLRVSNALKLSLDTTTQRNVFLIDLLKILLGLKIRGGTKTSLKHPAATTLACGT